MHFRKAFILFILLSVTMAQPLPALQGAEPPGGQSDVTPGFDLTALDRATDPCTDFYQFACGGWIARNPAPPDQPKWSRFDELQRRNLATLRRILEAAAAARNSPDVDAAKIGGNYASCMDEPAIDARGLTPLDAYLEPIRAIASTADLSAAIGRLHRLGVRVAFRFRSEQDFKDATSVIAVADQGGLGLPDRDLYLKEDPRTAALRTQYGAHVERMFGLMGDPVSTARAKAATIMAIETAFARASLDRAQRRDPARLYHKTTMAQVAASTPSFDWARYLRSIGVPDIKVLNVAVPEFLAAVEQQIQQRSLEEWKTYLTWHLVRTSAPVLASALVDENFSFYGRTLTGASQLAPRWRRCVEATDRSLGEALGRLFVGETFGADGKLRALAMVRALEKALQADIRDLSWMSEPTKRQARAKLDAIAEKIGYPDRWRDYGRLEIVRGDALGNLFRSNSFEFDRQMAKIGRPVDRAEWLISPPTVDAYYDPQMNNINFPAGILQPPFFDRDLDDAVNFGAIGAVIGHELTHGFDDEGRQFDAEGNLRDWWTPEDAHRFEERTACLVTQYGGYTAIDEVTLNGKLTLGENTADHGGVRLALMALVDTLGGRRVPPIDGFTSEQRFFLGWGQIWCQNQTAEMARLLAVTDPHSPGKYRVNGVVSSMPEFQKAFNCSAGAAMVRENMCRVW